MFKAIPVFSGSILFFLLINPAWAIVRGNYQFSYTIDSDYAPATTAVVRGNLPPGFNYAACSQTTGPCDGPGSAGASESFVSTSVDSSAPSTVVRGNAHFSYDIYASTVESSPTVVRGNLPPSYRFVVSARNDDTGETSIINASIDNVYPGSSPYALWEANTTLSATSTLISGSVPPTNAIIGEIAQDLAATVTAANAYRLASSYEEQVRNLYRLYLEREASPSDVSWRAGLARSGAAPLWSQESDIANSDEALSKKISNAYRIHLGRAATAGEISWRISVHRSGYSVTKQAADIAISEEAIRYQVTGFYRTILRRHPAAWEVTYWTQQIIARTKTVAQVRAAFLGSLEYAYLPK